jgi:hypothetical protein
MLIASIAQTARVTVMETDTVGLRFRRWMPFPGAGVRQEWPLTIPGHCGAANDSRQTRSWRITAQGWSGGRHNRDDPCPGSVHYRTLLAKSTIRLEDAQNPIRHLGLERGFPPSIAVQTAALEFANSVIIGTQEYGRALSQIGNMPFQAHLSLS